MKSLDEISLNYIPVDFSTNHPFKPAYRRHEREKRRQYEQRVREVEHGHFTPLVFTTTGGMGDAAGQVYK